MSSRKGPTKKHRKANNKDQDTSFLQGVSRFLTPQVWKNAIGQLRPTRACRWALRPLVMVMLLMTWSAGDSEAERFFKAQAAYVSLRQHDKRPGETLAGFHKALLRVPMFVLRWLPAGVRRQIERVIGLPCLNGWVPIGCDGSRLECPRTAELERHLGQAGKPDAAPTVWVTTMVVLPLGLLWSWRLGLGTASEQMHALQLLSTLPPNALLVTDAGYLGYDLFAAVQKQQTAFLVRMSSRADLYTEEKISLDDFTEGIVYYWPKWVQKKKLPPLEVRLLRVRGDKGDVWLLTNILDPARLSLEDASQVYRWRWQNEGLFRIYKQTLNKVKLAARTVALVHREAELSLLAVQLLLAHGVAEENSARKQMKPSSANSTPPASTCSINAANLQRLEVKISPRSLLLQARGELDEALGKLGPQQFRCYKERLAAIQSQPRPNRLSAKTRRPWPRRKDHDPPGPPNFRVVPDEAKGLLQKALKLA